MRYFCYTSPGGDGFRNLAIDEYFLNTLPADAFLLYFYINENAVIIGRNQNGWKECNLSTMEQDQVQLVRRMSGGGAVFHDKGNLNFSFHTPKDCYDVEKQLSVVLEGVKALGIDAVFSGRNDLITQEGQKFSGNAFCARGERQLHHGTILVQANLSKLAQYLHVSKAKIQAKGVSSVRARVCNLQELVPSLTVAETEQAVRQAYTQVYGPWEEWKIQEGEEAIQALTQRNESKEWQLGATPPFSWQGETRFPWGEFSLGLEVQEGKIAATSLWTDALDIHLPQQLCDALVSLPFHRETLAAALANTDSAPLQDMAQWLLQQEF